MLLHVMKSTKSGLNNNAGPNALLSPFGPVRASGFWKMVAHYVICKDFVLPKGTGKILVNGD